MLWNVIGAIVLVAIMFVIFAVIPFVHIWRFPREEREAEQMRMEDQWMGVLFRLFKSKKWWPL